MRRTAISDQTIGVVIVNLGTPDDATTPAVRRYLRQFLRDRRIVPMSPLVWRVILEAFILPTRPRVSAAKYRSIWTANGSPLLVHTLAQAAALQQRFAASPDASEVTLGQSTAVRVVAAMRYGQPSLDRVLDQLAASAVERVLIVPMYPQFSTTTVASVYDALASYMQSRGDQFEYRTVRSWPADPGYIEACARRIESHWRQVGRPNLAAGDKVLFSYHGEPVAAVQAGDPYPDECQQTTKLLRQRLGLDEASALMTFQSKFGRGQWLTPATIDTVAALGAAGTKRLDVFCPGFVADCLETDEEIDQLNQQAFVNHGGQQFNRVPCLNDSPAWIDALEALVRTHLAGWTT